MSHRNPWPKVRRVSRTEGVVHQDIHERIREEEVVDGDTLLVERHRDDDGDEHDGTQKEVVVGRRLHNRTWEEVVLPYCRCRQDYHYRRPHCLWKHFGPRAIETKVRDPQAHSRWWVPSLEKALPRHPDPEKTCYGFEFGDAEVAAGLEGSDLTRR